MPYRSPAPSRRPGRPGRLVRFACIAALLAVMPSGPAAAQFSDRYNFLKAVRDRDFLKARDYIDKPGSTIINLKDQDSGETALHIVTRRRDVPWLSYLLESGADPNQRDSEGNTPVVVAASSGFADGVKLLIAYKADVNVPNQQGETALIRAVQMRDLNAAKLLLDAGADPDRPDNLAGRSARDYAARDIRSGPLAKLLAEAPAVKKGGRMGPSL
jgi:ankyrin repeat protein